MKHDFIIVMNDKSVQFLVKRPAGLSNHNVHDHIEKCISRAKEASPSEWNFSDVKADLIYRGYEVFSCQEYDCGN